MKLQHRTFLFLLVFFIGLVAKADNKNLGLSNNNPLLPGYFADPTIKKFGDTFYIYSTTDGVKLASGEPTVWISTDLQNWYNQEMQIDLPDGLTNCWAPDVVKGLDGNYYYYMGNCQFGCNIYGYVSDNPVGPWKPINEGKPVIPVGTGKKHLPALDAQFLMDYDGSFYSFFGTWCTSFGGLGWAKINSVDMHTIENEGLISVKQLPLVFEAAYPLKRDSTYFLMYSAGDCKLNSYAVHYAWANNPIGPYTYGENNPVLETNADGTVDGPGHHSVLKVGEEYYIIYHRHDNPHSSGGMFRQVCIDRMKFADNHTIERIIPTNEGLTDLPYPSNLPVNIAFGAFVSASSSYHLVAPKNRYTRQKTDYIFAPENVVDNDNGALWKAADASFPQNIVVDLGKTENIQRLVLEFEYPTFYYQYYIEISKDQNKWEKVIDQTANRISGSPLLNDFNANARYVRITITGVEKTGLFAALWNIKMYNQLFEIPEVDNLPSVDDPGVASSKSILVDLSVNDSNEGNTNQELNNKGTLGGAFIPKGEVFVETIEGVKAIKFDGNSFLKLDKKAPESLAWNAPFTTSVWVMNPEVGAGECLLAWNSRDDMLQGSYAASYYGSANYGAVAHGDGALDLPFSIVPEAGKWHHIAVTFDGMIEKVYVDGELNAQLPMMLFVKPADILIGASGQHEENFSGYINSVRLYDYALIDDNIEKLFDETNPIISED